MKRKIIKMAIIGSMIGFLLGGVFARGPMLLLYINSYLASSLGDGEVMMLFFCFQLHIRPLVASIGAILTFLMGIFQMRRSIFVGQTAVIGVIFLIIIAIVAAVALGSISLAMIELGFSLNDLTNLFFVPWCWGQW